MFIAMNNETGIFEQVHEFECKSCSKIAFCSSDDIEVLKKTKCHICGSTRWEQVVESEDEEDDDIQD